MILPCASRLPRPPVSVAPVSIVKALVSAPVTASVPVATVVEATCEVPLSVSLPVVCATIAPVPSIAPA